jgi:hypothetical protein
MRIVFIFYFSFEHPSLPLLRRARTKVPTSDDIPFFGSEIQWSASRVSRVPCVRRLGNLNTALYYHLSPGSLKLISARERSGVPVEPPSAARPFLLQSAFQRDSGVSMRDVWLRCDIICVCMNRGPLSGTVDEGSDEDSLLQVARGARLGPRAMVDAFYPYGRSTSFVPRVYPA